MNQQIRLGMREDSPGGGTVAPTLTHAPAHTHQRKVAKEKGSVADSQEKARDGS
jgi:uncharacterized protein YwbE